MGRDRTAASEQAFAPGATPTTSGAESLSWSRQRTAWIVLLVGVLLTVGAFSFVRARDAQKQKLEFERRARDVALGLEIAVEAPLEAVVSLADFVHAHGEPTEESFRTFARPALKRHDSIAALEWAPLVPDAERAAFEAEAGFTIREPGPSGMKTAPERARYFPIRHIVPPSDEVSGLDVAFEPERRAVVERTLKLGKTVVSSRFKLVEDPPGRYSVALYTPVYEAPDRRKVVKGLAIGIVRLGPVVEAGLSGANLHGLRVALLDTTASGDERVLYETVPGTAADMPESVLTWQKPVGYGDRQWAMAFVGSPGAFTAGDAGFSVLGLGLLVTLFAAGGLGVATHVRRLRAEVRAAKQLGQYTLVSKLGEGGMGAVYRAEHALLRRPTAIKLVRQDTVGREAVERFEREVRVTSQLTHPNTIAVYDFGLTPAGVFYYAMELLDGLDCDELVEYIGALPPGRVVRLLEQACGSLAEAHSLGVVHRDVKPANIMVSDRGGIADMVKVLDFGLVKRTRGDEADSKLTADGGMLGTPLYMPPEAMTHPDEVGPAADVYSLGAVAYYLVCGRDVFSGSTVMEICSKHMTAAPTPPSEHVDCPPELEALILRCLSKDPAERPKDAGELLAELRKLRGIEPWTDEDAKQWWSGTGRALVEIHHGPRSLSPTGSTMQIDLAHR